jgi:hypothetical protein
MQPDFHIPLVLLSSINGHKRQPHVGVPPIGYGRSAGTLVATRKKSWRLDGHKADRQRDWLGVSKRHPYLIQGERSETLVGKPGLP